MGIFIDPRLPQLLEIEEPNRQQKRRIERQPTRCWRCGDLLSADDVCFAEGKDAHRSCAELFNYEILDGLALLRTQDENQLAMVAAERKNMQREARGALASAP